MFESKLYITEFNYQSLEDETNTKLLLMLPMVPRKALNEIRLNHSKKFMKKTTSNLQLK